MADELTDTSATAPTAASAAEIIDGWFQREFSDSVVSRDTTLWNFVHAAKDRLKDLLA